MDRNKTVAAVLGILGTLAAVVLLRKKAIPPETLLGANIVSIAVLDQLGQEVPHNSAVQLQRGASYTVKATVTNLSTAGGSPVAATLKTVMMAKANSSSLMAQQFVTEDFGPGETQVITAPWPLNVPTNIPVGHSGEIAAYVFDPNNNVLAVGTLPIEIV